MVAAAVWTVMYNADLLVKALSVSTARIGRLRPVIVTAVAYPMSSKFRTGLTLAMFSLVVFTLVVMSVLTAGFSASITDDLDTVLGEWDIEANVNPNSPIGDIRQAIAEEPKLRIEDFEAIGGLTTLGVRVRELNGEDPEWRHYRVRAVDDEFLGAARYELKLIAEGYGTTPEEVWKALKEDPTLAVIEGIALRSNRETEDFRPLDFDSLHYDDESMTPLQIEVREPRTGAIVPLTVIGVLDRKHETINENAGMIVSKSAIDARRPVPRAHHGLPVQGCRGGGRGADRQGPRDHFCRARYGGRGPGRALGRGGGRLQRLHQHIYRLHGAGPGRGYRRPWRHQHQGCGRAPSADRRAARHRLPAPHGAGSAFSWSRRSLRCLARRSG